MRVLAWVLIALFMLTVGLAALAAALFLQPAPSISTSPAAAPSAVDTAKLRREVEMAIEADDGPTARFVTAGSETLESLVSQAAARIGAPLTEVTLESGAMQVEAAIPLRWSGAAPWINLSATIPSFDGAARLSELHIGGLSLRPELAPNLLALAARGHPTANTARQAYERWTGLDARPDGVTLRFGGDGAPMPRAPVLSDLAPYSDALRAGIVSGQLPSGGDLAPILRALVAKALERSGAQADWPHALRSALLALARQCGTHDIRSDLGEMVAHGGDYTPVPAANVPCGAAHLHGRPDLARRFLASGATEAVFQSGAKTGPFDDIRSGAHLVGPDARTFDAAHLVAHRAGARLANRLMSASLEEAAAHIAEIEDATDILPGIADLPPPMTIWTVRETFGGLGEDAYVSLLEHIDTRIANLRFHGTALQGAPEQLEKGR